MRVEKTAHSIDAPEKPLPPLAAEKPHAAPAPEKEDRLHWMNRMLKIAAYPIAAISGLWAASTELHIGAYQKMRNVVGNPYFGKVNAAFDQPKLENLRKIQAGEISNAEWFAEETAIKHKQSRAVGLVMEEKGLSENMFNLKAMYNKIGFVNRETRSKAIINGLTVAGIAIGALLTISNSKALTEWFSDKEGKER